MERPYRQHLSESAELITSYEERRAGFLSLALERNRRATPLVAEARALKSAVSRVSKPADLLTMTQLQPALLTAGGLSDKAVNHLLAEDKAKAIRELIEMFLEPAGSAFTDELVYRFLLTRGDTLGGSMRNIGGALAQQKWTNALLASLSVLGIPYTWLHARSKIWLEADSEDTDIAPHLRGVHWLSNGEPRCLLYNHTVSFVRKNVDMILLHTTPEGFGEDSKRAECYLALGELKGGIDPAGADEHWKTARTALSRIRQAFVRQQLAPQMFFAGAAIERAMAEEIWEELEAETLSNVANLTSSTQLTSLCFWLIGL